MKAKSKENTKTVHKLKRKFIQPATQRPWQQMNGKQRRESMHISQPLGTGLGIVNGFQIGVVTFPSESQGEFHVDSHGTIGGHIGDVKDVVTDYLNRLTQ